MSWVIQIEDRGGHDGVATGGHYGYWKRIWISRPGVATYRIIEEDHYRQTGGRLNYHHDRITVEVNLTDKFDPQKDYLIVEHKRSPNPYLSGSSRRESYELLAGRMPAWADFPKAWAEWVEQVRGEAISFLIEKADGSQWELVEYACRKAAKRRIIFAWRQVAEAFGVEPPEASSWTSVRAMPVRIARALGWRAPVPPPRFEARCEGRNAFLLCSPETLSLS